jgi:hypothetical protein
VLSLENGRIQVEKYPLSQADLTHAEVLPLAPGIGDVTILLSRVVPGHAASASLGVTDACGEWQTLVGGGPHAF